MSHLSKKVINFYVLIILILCVLLVWSVLAIVTKTTNTTATVSALGQSSKSNQIEQIKWRLVTTWPKNFPGLGETPERFAKLAKEMSDGRIDIKVYGAGELVPALSVFSAVSAGSVEMGNSAAYYWKGKIRSSPFFTAVPFGLNAQETSAWLHEGGGLELWRKIYAPFNIIPFSAGSTGIQLAGWFNKKIRTLDDIKGLKMRVPGIAGEVFKRLGGIAVTIPGAELYTAMQTGVIDATEWVGPYNDTTFGLHEVAKYYYYPGWHEPGATLEFLVNKTAWEKLPADLKSILKIAMLASHQMSLDTFTANNSIYLAQLKEQHNIVPERLPEVVVSRLREESKKYYQEMSSIDPQFKEVYQSYLKFYGAVENWHNISERAYYEARDGFIED